MKTIIISILLTLLVGCTSHRNYTKTVFMPDTIPAQLQPDVYDEQH